MVRRGAALMCAALLMLPSSAEAEPTIAERLRIQGGAFTERHPAPQPRVNSFYGAVVPELALFWARQASLLSLTYTLTGAGNVLPTDAAINTSGELSNRLVLSSLWDLSSRTTLILSAEAAQTTFANYLISQPASASNVNLLPSSITTNKMLTTRVSEGVSYELSRRLRFQQGADFGYLTSIWQTPRLETLIANANVGLDHIWGRSDAIGGELRASYANTIVPPPSPSQEIVTLTGAPHWRHDWSNTLSTQLAGGMSVVFPLSGGDPLLAPFGRASAMYLWEETTLGLNYSVGVAASPLTGQIIRSHQVTANVFTPISQHEHVFLGASAGVLHGDVLNLVNSANNQAYDSLLADADVTWQISSRVGLFARYQFIAQLADVTALGVNPSFLRDFFLVGVQLSSRPAGGDLVPTRFPQRVDGRDSPASAGSSAGAASPPAK